MRILRALFFTLRPRQWSKNVVVFIPFIFTLNQAWQLFSPEMYRLFGLSFLAFALFCLLSGCVYLINDIADIEKDRLHPTKRNRPLPSGQLPVRVAVAAAILILTFTVTAAFLVRPTFAWICVLYFAINVGYSFVFKHWVIVDVFAVSSGFVLRAIAGALMIDVTISPWLFVVAILLSLVISINKRRNELLLLQEDAVAHRTTLGDYTLELLDEMTAVVTSATVMAYSLYTFSAETLPKNHQMMFTIPFAIYGIFRYLYLVHVKNEGGDPSELLIKDRPLLIAIALWGVTVLGILYFAR